MNSSSQVMQTLASHFEEIRPQIPTFLTVAIAAVIPIYAGAHASLSRPATAAKPKKKDGRKKSQSADRRMEGLAPSDALFYPVATGAMLTGLYYLIKWLQDPEIINKIINWYLTGFGLIAIWQLVRDLLLLTFSFIFPTRYSHRSAVWTVERANRRFVVDSPAEQNSTELNASPLPGLLSQIPIPSGLSSFLWRIRKVCIEPYAIVDVFIKDSDSSATEINLSSTLAAVVALSTVLYYNLVDRPWWLTNLFGFSLCYSGLQLVSPTTFWTGTLILTSLFFYDIYFVFYTPMMIKVATTLDIPAKLLIPKASTDTQGQRALTLLGLGDIVLPGMMLGLALRFDLYMHYLRRQRHNNSDTNLPTGDQTKAPVKEQSTVKAEYVTATGNWGERFWLDSIALKSEGGSFPKVYFNSGTIGYVFGLLVTETVMTISKHGQPALLYLVPSVLGSLWTTAALRGEVNLMWTYTEAEQGESAKKIAKPKDKKITTGQGEMVLTSSAGKKGESDHVDATDAAGDENTGMLDQNHSGRSSDRSQESKIDSTTVDSKKLFHLSISLPEDPETELHSQDIEDE